MTVQFITTPGGEELAVLPRSDDEDLVDAIAARDARDALDAGTEELLDGTDVRTRLDARSPIAALDQGMGGAPLDHYRRAASLLRVALEDLVPST